MHILIVPTLQQSSSVHVLFVDTHAMFTTGVLLHISER